MKGNTSSTMTDKIANEPQKKPTSLEGNEGPVPGNDWDLGLGVPGCAVALISIPWLDCAPSTEHSFPCAPMVVNKWSQIASLCQEQRL